jgi:hypothetical protein
LAILRAKTTARRTPDEIYPNLIAERCHRN